MNSRTNNSSELEYHTLPNGIQVLIDSDQNRESVAIALGFNVGSRNEPENLAGISHVLEHMFFKGTPTRNYQQINREFDRIGATLNAFTDRDMTVYYAKATHEHTDLIIDLWADMLQHSILDKGEFIKERNVVYQEYLRYLDNGIALGISHAYSACFPQLNLGRPIIGKGETIQSMTRDDIASYWKTMYRPSNLLISISGHVDTQKTLKKLISTFSQMPIQEPNPQDDSQIQTPQNPTGTNWYFYPDNKPESYILLASPTLPTSHPEMGSVAVMDTFIAHSQGSALYQKLITETGIASRVVSYFEQFPDVGIYITVITCPPSEVKQVLSLTESTIRNLKNTPISLGQLSSAKSQLTGELAIYLEDTYNLSVWYIQQRFRHRRLMRVKEYIEEINSVTPSMVNERLCDIFNPETQKILLGTFPEIDSIKLGF